ncbi:MAG TPA: alkaline phosphatase family protein [Solimonas sp.]|nr:alkaline phosphatase family protein [Solimonas sp.]
MSKPRNDSIDSSRRRLLAGLAAAPAVGLSASCSSGGADPAASAPPQPLPDPKDSGIDHIVVVMMENRSFDHYLGWAPGADGRQAGLKFADKSGRAIDSFRLSEREEYGYQGCGKEDPDHGYDAGRLHLNGGTMDGWLKTVGDTSIDTDHFPIGYYTADDLPFFKGAVEHYTIGDRYFHGILASTFPNRVYLHAGETDRRSNTFTISQLPTIWDRLAAKGRSGLYYFNDLPLTALWGTKHLAISRPAATFYTDAALGLLPDVAYIDPRFLQESPDGYSNDDHPQADVRNGQAFLDGIYTALRDSPKWERTLMIVCYDEWGGFYDHVAPPVGPVSAAEAALPNDGRLGFRTPFALIGPRARKGHVTHLQFDVNSILNFIAWRFGLDGISARAGWSMNLAHALDFAGAPRTDKPDFAVPAGPFGANCSNSLPVVLPNGGLTSLLGSLTAADIKQAQHNLEWLGLRDLAKANGFAVR